MIQIIQEKYPQATMQARRDYAHVTGQRIVERPYWFMDTETGKEYHSLYAGIGWPQRVSEKADQLPGYAVIVGIVKGKGPAEDARWDIVAEIEEMSVDLLIDRCVKLRTLWGFGAHPSLLRHFYGDYRLFELVVASYNTRLLEAGGDERDAFVVTPPDDFDSPQAFDVYVRRLQSVLSADAKRLYLGGHKILRNRITSFRRDDPAIMAVGGLVHTLLMRQPWMEQTTPGAFQVEEAA